MTSCDIEPYQIAIQDVSNDFEHKTARSGFLFNIRGYLLCLLRTHRNFCVSQFLVGLGGVYPWSRKK